MRQWSIFWSIKDKLSIDGDLIVYGCLLFILATLRATMLSCLHEAYQGISRSQARTRLTIYWQGINNDIEHFILQGCRHCQDRLPSHAREPMTLKPDPEQPFQQIAADFASHAGRQFFIFVDCKTNWPDIIEMGKDTTTTRPQGPVLSHGSPWLIMVRWRTAIHISLISRIPAHLGRISYDFLATLPPE